MPFPSTIQIIVRTGRHSDPHSLIEQVDKMVEEQKKNGRLRSGDPAWIILEINGPKPQLKSICRLVLLSIANSM